MNTLQRNAPMIELTGDHVILLEDLEFSMPVKQLERITRLHNEGVDFQEISQRVKRNPYEVVLALLHQTKRGKGIKPFAYRELEN